MPETKTLITAEAAQVLQEIKDYLQKPEIVKVNIKTDIEHKRAVEFGNELQKMRSTLEKTRKNEKRPYDDLADQVQQMFTPVLTLIDQRKSLLSQAIRDYDYELERKAKLEMEQAQIEWKKEMETMDAQASSFEEKAKALKEKADEALAEAQKLWPQAPEYNRLMQRSRDFNARSEQWAAKANNKREVIQAPPPPPIVVMPEKQKGTRVSADYEITVVDKKAFIVHVLECGDLFLLDVNEKGLKNEAKQSEGTKVRPGIKVAVSQKYGFSGR